MTSDYHLPPRHVRPRFTPSQLARRGCCCGLCDFLRSDFRDRVRTTLLLKTITHNLTISLQMAQLLDDMDFANQWVALCDSMHREQFAAFDVASQLEEMSLWINDAYGRQPLCQEISRHLKYLARDVQRMPVRTPYHERPRRLQERPWWWSQSQRDVLWTLAI